MFNNFNTFVPFQTSSPLGENPPSKPSRKFSPTSFPESNEIWGPSSYLTAIQQESTIKEDIPYNVRVLLEDEEANSTSSDSNQTNTMSGAHPSTFRTYDIKDWDFGQDGAGRKTSESNISMFTRTTSNSGIVGNQNSLWHTEIGGKVIVKPNNFVPLNLASYISREKRAYFVTIEGFNTVTSKRVFKIERLCHSLQGKTGVHEGGDNKNFLYIGLWNDIQSEQDDSENIFEPWLHGFQLLQFRLVVTISLSHSYEDPYTFELPIDLRQFALPTKEKRVQGLEVVYAEDNSGQTISNNVKLHVQLTNQKVVMQHGFKNAQEQREDQSPLEYTVILRQLFIQVPLCRSGSSYSTNTSSILTQDKQLNAHDPYAKRCSETSIGQQSRPCGLENFPQSPLSWPDFAPDKSPTQRKNIKKLQQQDMRDEPILPPGILAGPATLVGQQRFVAQPVTKQIEEVDFRRVNRILPTDLSEIPRDKGPVKVPAGEPGTQAKQGENKAKPNGGVQEEFRIEDHVGSIADLARTAQGSKVLQKHIVTADKEELDIIVDELGEKIGELMLDSHANYVVQTLVQNASPKQKLYVIQKVGPWFGKIARDKKGTHSLQAVIEQLNSPEEYAVIRKSVGDSLVDLALDSKATYVVQKMISVIPLESSQFMYQALFNGFVHIATNSFGLLVLKQLMERVKQKNNLKQKIIELACLNFESLVHHPYGNYAIQNILETYQKESSPILNKALAKFVPYSGQKISSNVIEKCLGICDAQFKRRIVDEILRNGRLGDLLKNKYGNFVTLQLLATTSPYDQQRLMQEIFRCASGFNGVKYKTRWLKFIEENPLKIEWDPSGGKSKGENDYEVEKQTQEKLEAVKKIWRDMVKDEKGEVYSQKGGNPGGNKLYLAKKSAF